MEFAAVVSHAGCDRLTARPAVLCVMLPLIDAPPVKPVVVPATLPAFSDSPALFAVQARGPAVRAVLVPMASLLALAVVR